LSTDNQHGDMNRNRRQLVPDHLRPLLGFVYDEFAEVGSAPRWWAQRPFLTFRPHASASDHWSPPGARAPPF
jgi:hypothetical protein